MTPNKRKVIEEMRLQWSFVRQIYEDVCKIADKLDKRQIVPTLPQIHIYDGLWDVENFGLQSLICDVSEQIGDFQTSLMDAVWKLQEVCE